MSQEGGSGVAAAGSAPSDAKGNDKHSGRGGDDCEHSAARPASAAGREVTSGGRASSGCRPGVVSTYGSCSIEECAASRVEGMLPTLGSVRGNKH
eukprot:scaffold96169_cov31-Tisochrysis_lutea.AAC.2